MTGPDLSNDAFLRAAARLEGIDCPPEGRGGLLMSKEDSAVFRAALVMGVRVIKLLPIVIPASVWREL